jgi:hypothetical protein
MRERGSVARRGAATAKQTGSLEGQAGGMSGYQVYIGVGAATLLLQVLLLLLLF